MSSKYHCVVHHAKQVYLLFIPEVFIRRTARNMPVLNRRENRRQLASKFDGR